MSEAADQRFAPPQAHVADLASGEMVLAGRGVRLVAVIVDAIIAGCAAWAVVLIPPLNAMFEKQTQEAAAAGLWSWTPFSMLLGAVLFLAIQGWPLLTRGQTLGKMLLKVRIVRSDGSRPEAWRLLGLRYGVGLLLNFNLAVAMLYGLIDSLLIFRTSRKCLHDSIADTKVIKL